MIHLWGHFGCGWKFKSLSHPVDFILGDQMLFFGNVQHFRKPLDPFFPCWIFELHIAKFADAGLYQPFQKVIWNDFFIEQWFNI